MRQSVESSLSADQASSTASLRESEAVDHDSTGNEALPQTDEDKEQGSTFIELQLKSLIVLIFIMN